MRTRKIGQLEVSAVGLAAMGFSHGFGPGVPDDEAVARMRRAYELGCTHFDTAEGYEHGENERLVGTAVAPFRDHVVLATKLFVHPARTLGELGNQIRQHLHASLQRLGTDHIELYYQHRVPDTIPVEDVAGVMGELIAQGLIGGWGQAQASAEQIRRAHAVTPLTAVQSEYSMMERSVEAEVLPACEELGIGFVPVSPLASGFLSGRVRAGDSGDARRAVAHFDPDVIAANQPLVDFLHRLAADHDVTPAQLALAWMLHKKPFIAPIPGSRERERIQENLAAADLELTATEFERIEAELGELDDGDRRGAG
ncbi:MAG: aldo/keto reductase [Tetrasphaera sp.]